MSKYIRASIKHEAMMQIDDSVGLFRLAEAVPEFKARLLKQLKRGIQDKIDRLTVDMLTYEEVVMPDLPTYATDLSSEHKTAKPKASSGGTGIEL